MLDINAAYDFEPAAGGMRLSEDRRALYQECESRGMAVTVMKTFAGGRLLRQDMSPFGKAMTPYQCIQYALDRPCGGILPDRNKQSERNGAYIGLLQCYG